MIVLPGFKEHIHFNRNFTNKISTTVPVERLNVSIALGVKSELS